MRMDLEIDLLRAFVAIADTRNFTLAARRLNRVQSAISMKIKRLEDIVDCRLFERSQRPIALTAEGEILLEHARRILEVNEAALSAINAPPLHSPLRIGTSETYASCLMPQVLSIFSKAHPDIIVDIHCGHGWTLLAQMDAGDFDMVLAARQQGRTDGRLVRRERLLWVSSPGSDVSDADPLPLAVFPQGCFYRACAIQALDARRRGWRIAYTSSSHGGLVAAVLAGRAITVITESALEDGMRVLDDSDGFPALPMVEIVLYETKGERQEPAEQLAELIMLRLGRGVLDSGVSRSGNGPPPPLDRVRPSKGGRPLALARGHITFGSRGRG